MKLVSMFLLCSVICFFGGYKYALSTNDMASDLLVNSENNQSIVTQKNKQQGNVIRNDAQLNSLNINEINDSKLFNAASNSPFDKLETSGINAMLANIQALKGQHNSRYLIANQVDFLKTFLVKHPEQLDLAIAQLDALPIDSSAFSILISAIQAMPRQIADNGLLKLAKQYAEQPDIQSQEKFVSLLARTSAQIDSTEIVQSLVDLTILDQTGLNLKLEALGLLKPFQIKPSEKDLIVTQLKSELYHANGHEAELLLPHLIRFATKGQRSEIATDLLLGDTPEPLRSAVLENISSGGISITDSIKTMLMGIAINEKDALSREAQTTLLQEFDLTYQEYSQMTYK